MKVYDTAAPTYAWRHAALMFDYLDGRYHKGEEHSELIVTDTPPDTTNIWGSMEFHGLPVEIVYEIDLPHSEAELEPYKCKREPYWRLPWYIVAGHPVKIMKASIEHRIMGVPLTPYHHKSAAPGPDTSLAESLTSVLLAPESGAAQF
jgi:hypothetical protein